MISIVNLRFLANELHSSSVLNVPRMDIFKVFNTLINMKWKNVLGLCKCMFIVVATIQRRTNTVTDVDRALCSCLVRSGLDCSCLLLLLCTTEAPSVSSLCFIDCQS